MQRTSEQCEDSGQAEGEGRQTDALAEETWRRSGCACGVFAGEEIPRIDRLPLYTTGRLEYTMGSAEYTMGRL